MKNAWITQHRDSFPITVMCDVLLVSTSGHYVSLGRQPSSLAERHQRIQHFIHQFHSEPHGTYGSHNVTRILRKRGELGSACRNTVAVTMRELGLSQHCSALGLLRLKIVAVADE